MIKITIHISSLILFLLAASCQSSSAAGGSFSVVSPLSSPVDFTLSATGYADEDLDGEYSGMSLRYESAGDATIGFVLTPEAKYSFDTLYWLDTGAGVELTSPEYGVFGRRYFDNVFLEASLMLGSGAEANYAGATDSDGYSYVRFSAGMRQYLADQLFGDISVGSRFDLVSMEHPGLETEISGFDVFAGLGYDF